MHDSLPENERLHAWLNGELPGEAFPGDEGLMRILQASAGLKVPEGISKEEAWQRFADRAGLQEKPQARLRLMPWLAAAAMVALLLAGAWLLWPRGEVVQRTYRAEQGGFALPDGSRVSLNADSEVKYAEAGWEQDRTLSLKGEAFFEVKPGAAFTVLTENGSVQVLGTSFNVFARDALLEVACFSGKVSVTSGEVTQVLIPGQAARAPEAGGLEVFSFEKENPISWQKGEFYFENTPINHVIAVLERQYDVEIEGMELSGRTYTGYFTNKDLEEALKLVCIPLNISYSRIDPHRIRLDDAVIHE